MPLHSASIENCSLEFRQHFASDDLGQYQTQKDARSYFDSLTPRMHPLVKVVLGQRDRPELPEPCWCGRGLLGRVLRAQTVVGWVCVWQETRYQEQCFTAQINLIVRVFVQDTVALIILR